VGYDNVGSQYGWLNFPEGWPVEGASNPPASCPSTGGANDLKDYIGQMGGVGTSAGFQPTLWNIPIWVCAKDGANASAQQAIQDWADTYRNEDPRPVVSFPVVAPAGSPCPPEGCWPRYGNPNASYPVIRMQGFYMENLYRGPEMKKAGLADECGFDKKVGGNAFCIELTVVDPNQNPTNGSPTVRLID
jgi:hypothetical protein